MLREVVVASVVLSLLHGPSCGDVDSASSGLNAPCTRERDCQSGLACVEGVCVDPDGGRDGGLSVDASSPLEAGPG